MSKLINRIARRRVLQGGAGVVLGLPLLDVFTRFADAQAQGPKIYSALLLQQNGAIQGRGDDPDLFWPRATGTLSAAAMLGADADRTTSELSAYADKLMMVRGLDFHYSNNHDGGPVAASTGAPITGSGVDQLPVSESADYFIAANLTPDQEPLNLYASRKNTFRDDAFSFGPGGELRIGDNSPWNAYQRLVGLAGTDPEIVQQIAARRLSVNDLIRTELDELLARPDLSEADRQRLDLHLSSVRDMEINMSNTMALVDEDAMQGIEGEHTEYNNIETVTNMMIDLIAFAFASDRVRTATLQIGGCNSHGVYTINGVEAPPFHFISHRVMSDGGDGESIPDAVELHHQIDRIHARHFRHLMDRMSAYVLPTGGTLLDNSVNLWVNSVSDGPPHSGDSIPQVLAGGAGGFLKTGQFIEKSGYTNLVLNTLITATGVRKSNGAYVDDFGDPESIGVLDELIA
ncbi:MAG TPA: DUF1552 domain-containing protein [Polyangiaceae bacterium]|nr:DUF1552 domain-containing protein [Polyangiaceae bacterium]